MRSGECASGELLCVKDEKHQFPMQRVQDLLALTQKEVVVKENNQQFEFDVEDFLLEELKNRRRLE